MAPRPFRPLCAAVATAAVAVAALCAAPGAAAQAGGVASPTACGVVTGLAGQVTVAGNAGSEPAGRGTPLAVGDRVSTTRAGLAGVELDQGTRLRLAPNTRLSLAGGGCDPEAERYDVELRVASGALHVRAADGGESLRVRTAEATVRAGEGAAWTVTARPGVTAVRTLEGRVEVRGRAGDAVGLAADRSTLVSAGAAPERPRVAAPAQDPFWERPLAGPTATGASDPEAGGRGFSFATFERFAVTWLPIIFFAALVTLIALTLRLMPRTKPQQIKPQADSAVSWDDVAGVDETKDELREVVEFLSNPGSFRKLGATVPKGILLHGPPGTGKTLLAKAVAHESGANFFSQSAASFVEMFAGLGAARIRRLFRIAREHAPAIIFIDELDAVGGERGSDISGERDQTLNQLLVELDGFEARDEIVVMAASNLLDKLDKALLRPGRFDRQVFVPPPDREGRKRILEVHTVGKPLAQDVDLGGLAAHTAGLTGADLANLCNEAAIFAGRGKREFITQSDFDAAFERVVAGLESRKVITDDEKAVIAWHEAGHALVRECLPAVERVHKISIVPRGRALGYTLNMPEEDRYLRSKEDLLEQMAVLLGGRVAEQVTFGRVTTGAADDLMRVTEVARSMIYDYAMGTTLRSLQVARNDWTLSDQLKRIRDEEVQELADEAYRLAEQIIVGHRDILDALAQELLEREVMERVELDRVLAPLGAARNGAPAGRADARAPLA